MRTFDIAIRDSVFDPDTDEALIEYKLRKGGAALYKVYLFLEGTDLAYVRTVTYHLHQTISNPNRVVRRTATNPNCKLALWLWGFFEFTATIELKSNRKMTLNHEMKIDEELKNASQSDFKLVK